jgi:hypothetical protein
MISLQNTMCLPWKSEEVHLCTVKPAATGAQKSDCVAYPGKYLFLTSAARGGPAVRRRQVEKQEFTFCLCDMLTREREYENRRGSVEG